MRVVGPFRAGGKSRLPVELRTGLALAMLGDVVEAAGRVARVRVVTNDPDGARCATALGAAVVGDPGRGQGAAVAAGLAGAGGPCLVVNADLPCATPDALSRLAEAGGALVAAVDGTTNALSLPDPARFEPLYGPDSAARYAALGLVVARVPELALDVDTLDHLARLELPAGRRTRLALSEHELVAARGA